MIRKVAVLGLGYIGLPTVVAIAKTKKYDVVGYDVDEEKIKKLKKGISPIEDKTVEKYLKNYKTHTSTNSSILKSADVFIICVPTPVYNDYVPNYSYIISAIETIIPYIKKNCHIVLESTVNPGTCKEIILPILERNTKLRAGIDYNISHCPERINPGDSKWTIYNINRNIGSINTDFNKEIAAFYRSFIKKAKIHEVSSLEVAEASKIVENTFRDINIAYVNELAKSFDAMGIDLYETLQASSNKPFAFMAHWPGCGVGGHCIGVDPYYLIKKAASSGFDHKFLKLARDINNSMTKYTVEKLLLGLNELQLPIKRTPITLLGLTFKPNIGDTRESPSWEIKKELERLGADLTIYDPYVESECKTLKESLQKATAIVIATAHKEFVEKLPSLLPNTNVKLILDGRNCLNKNLLDAQLIYKGIGR